MAVISWLWLFVLDCQIAAALEPGFGRVRFLQGFQNIGAGFQQYKYFGLGCDLEQPTLNWGKWQANFLGLSNRWGQDPQLGYAFLGAHNIWLRDNLAGDFGLGDAPLLTDGPQFPFEHFVVPSQNFRGLGVALNGPNYALGLQAGTLTFMSFQFSEAYVRSDTNLVGCHFRLGELHRPHVGMAWHGFDDALGRRSLSHVNLSYPLGGPQAKAQAWFDSRSGHTAGVIGLRQDKRPVYWEVGASTIPFSFVYLSNNAALASGQTLGFFTYRRRMLLWDYGVEGSAGRLSYSGQQAWLARGAVGGGWRYRLRDYLGASLGVSQQWGDRQQRQLHLLPMLRYNHGRENLNLYAHLLSDYYTVQLINQSAAVVIQPQPLGVLPETQRVSILRHSAEIGMDFSPPTGTRKGFSLRFDDTRMQGYQSASYRAATGEVRLSRYLPYDTYLDFFARSGLTFSQGSTSGLHSAGLRLSCTHREGWLVYLEGRLYYSNFPQEFTSFTGTPNPAYEVRSGAERHFFWGEAAPVYGNFPTGGFKGVGTVSGLVFIDHNRNGIFDAGDTPLKNVVIRLDNGYLIETDARGRYFYPNIADGDHTLQLDPESYPLQLAPNDPEGINFRLNPRENRQFHWPLHPN